jgi:hypothetical protein
MSNDGTRSLLEALTHEQRVKVLEMVSTQDLLDELCERDPQQIEAGHEEALRLNRKLRLAQSN